MESFYIYQTSAIHPQRQSVADSLLQPLVDNRDNCFYCIEPDYTRLIPAQQLRRMSRILRMGVYAGLDCLANAGLARPDGVITGTAKGSMTDTEKFVKELKIYEEEALNPTPFILSTYNAINGALALQTGATGYNQTYVHRGSSFELALYDAQLKLQESGRGSYLLVGCFDEMTPEYFFVKKKAGYWKEEAVSSFALWEQKDHPGSIAGEGTAFFLLGKDPEGAIAQVHAVSTHFKLELSLLLPAIEQLLLPLQWGFEELDLLVLGFNGDGRDEPYYERVLSLFSEDIPVLVFKHLCGEYETSGGFALWLSLQLISGKELPEEIWYRKPPGKFTGGKMLYYNHYREINHNLLLLSC